MKDVCLSFGLFLRQIGDQGPSTTIYWSQKLQKLQAAHDTMDIYPPIPDSSQLQITIDIPSSPFILSLKRQGWTARRIKRNVWWSWPYRQPGWQNREEEPSYLKNWESRLSFSATLTLQVNILEQWDLTSGSTKIMIKAQLELIN